LWTKHRGWQFVLTLDESWFDFITDREHVWLCPEEQPPEKPKHTIQGPKKMVTNAWNPGDFICSTLFQRVRFSLLNIMMKIFSQHCFRSARRLMGKLMVHAENASRHTSPKCATFCAENTRRLATPPPYSSNLASVDLFFFGHVDCCLQGTIFRSREELLEAVHEIVTATPSETLHGLFEHCMERLEWVSQNNGDYSP
jgi:hypothetical protein